MAWRWLPDYPSSDSKISEIPGILSGNFAAIETVLGVEHVSLSGGALSGQHVPGIVSAIYEGTTSQINALSSPPEGALAYDTTIGFLKKYIGSSWVVMTNFHSRARSYIGTPSAITLATTESSTGNWVYFDTADIDTLSEITGDATSGTIFTAKGSGDYYIVCSVGLCAGNTVQQSQQDSTPISDLTADWAAAVPAGTHYTVIDDVPPDDNTYIMDNLSGHVDNYSQFWIGYKPVPPNPTGLYLTLNFRAREVGCSCDEVCFSEDCTCYLVCYGDGCGCDYECYGYQQCGCNVAEYEYEYCAKDGSSCTCFYLCYGYVACSCNYTCDAEIPCECNNRCYGEGESVCTCDYTCYNEFEIGFYPTIDLSGTAWTKFKTPAPFVPTSTWTDYSYTWTTSPSTSLEWIRDEINNVGYFGFISNCQAYDAVNNYITTGCSAQISEAYLTFGWYPTLPQTILRLYVNDSEVEKVFLPIADAGAQSSQNILLSTIVKLDSGDYVRFALVKITDDADSIVAGHPYSYVTFHRIEGQCV